MSKRYVHYRSDLANAAAAKTEGDANPKAWPVGALVVTADGKLNIVSANTGSAITVTVVGAQT